jgi:hypothetical protein
MAEDSEFQFKFKRVDHASTLGLLRSSVHSLSTGAIHCAIANEVFSLLATLCICFKEGKVRNKKGTKRCGSKFRILRWNSKIKINGVPQ